MYGVCKSFGIDAAMMAEAMQETVEKNRSRGYFDDVPEMKKGMSLEEYHLKNIADTLQAR